jgi:hypothetical protein
MLYIFNNVLKPNCVQNRLYEVKIDEFFAFKIALTGLKCSMLICFFLTSRHVIPTVTATTHIFISSLRKVRLLLMK